MNIIQSMMCLAVGISFVIGSAAASHYWNVNDFCAFVVVVAGIILTFIGCGVTRDEEQKKKIDR